MYNIYAYNDHFTAIWQTIAIVIKSRLRTMTRFEARTVEHLSEQRVISIILW